MRLMKRWIVPLLAAAACVQAGEMRVDTALIAKLPDRVAAARREADPGLSSGVTPEMRSALMKYNNALKAMILDLGKAGYAKPPSKSDVNGLEKALITRAQFAQNAENPGGEPLGTIAPLDVDSAVSDGLETTVVSMVKALLGSEDPAFTKWKKRWDAAVAGK